MRQAPDRDWELSIGPDTVRMLILKAKAVSAALSDDYVGGHEHEIELDDETHDGHHHDGLAEEEEEDLTEQELRQLIGDLNVDEAAELIALAWVGRGDFEAAEWGAALEEAKRRPRKRTATYLLGMPQLGDYLEEGLESIVP